MRVLYLVPPGRIPTVIVDPGLWWDTIAASGRHTISGYSANFHWWRAICNANVTQALLSRLGLTQKFRRRLEWRVGDLEISNTAETAAGALEALRTIMPYQGAAEFLAATKSLTEHLNALNKAQPEIEFTLTPGVRVRDLNYDDSHSLLAYAREDSVLAQLVANSTFDCPADIDFLAISVTSPESLLTAMIAARLLRERNPGMHVCLADHGYENFSLHAHMTKLRESGAIGQVFDTIIEAKDDRDTVLPQIIAAVADGPAPKGFITTQAFPAMPPRPVAAYSPPPPLPTFTPEPVFFTRLSRRRCYWSRCTFCTQNTKYDDPKAASRLDIPETLDRLATYLNAGYRNIVFSDEAIAPGTLKVLSEEIVKRKLDFQWTCRCRLELSHTRELFEQMRAAGCYEILFGLESISTRVQKLMDKHLAGMDETRVRRIFQDIDAAGLAVHVTLIAGFPGDRLADSERTVDFVIEALRGMRNATFYLNQFSLFPDTIILREPARFGIAEVYADGDMPSRYSFAFDPKSHSETEEVLREFPRLNDRLVEGLGWGSLGHGAPAKAAQVLYFTSGCGAVFKTQKANPFVNPLLNGLSVDSHGSVQISA